MFNKNLLMSELILLQINSSELAKMLDVSKSTLSKKLNGKSEFTLKEIQKIANLIDSDKTLQIFFAKQVS